MRHTLSIILVLAAQLLYAQDAEYFIKQLKDNSNDQVRTRLAVYDTLSKLDTIQLVKTLDEMEKSTGGASKKVKTKVAALRARLLFYKLGPGDSLYASRMKEALYKAYEMDESFMVAEYSRWYGEMLNTLKKREQAVQYALNALKLQESLGIENFPSFQVFNFVLAEMFYRTRNPEEAIIYYNKGFALPSKEPIDPVLYANSLNTLGMSYKWIKKYDSSLLFHVKCMEFSIKNNLEDWYYIASDNRYDPYLELKQYDSCKVIAESLYDEGVKTGDPQLLLAGYFLLGRLALRQGQFEKAIQYLLKSEEYSVIVGIKANSTRGYKDLAEAYDSIGQPALAYTYYRKFKQLQDSIDNKDKIINTNYLFAQANFEKEQLNFNKLRAKKEKDIRLRNIGIVGLAISSGLIIWWLNRKRKKARQSQEEAQQQLKIFTENILNKDRQIEALQNELQQQSHSSEKAAKVEELAQQMILTEEDWQRFQSLFNKTYPGFLLRLKEKAAGITEAELRMATLIKIRLGTRQISAMQGIGADTVHKTRQRLRQRFGTSSTTELEAIITTV